MNEYPMFDKIIQHLNRKKPKPTYNSNKQPIKPVYYFNDMLKTEKNYIQIVVDYNCCHMAITYSPEKRNPYKVWIETQCIMGMIRQELGTKYWEDDWHRQEDVIEYIRYKLR